MENEKVWSSGCGRNSKLFSFRKLNQPEVYNRERILSGGGSCPDFKLICRMADMEIKQLLTATILLLFCWYGGNISICAQTLDSESAERESYEAEEMKRALSHYKRARKLYQEGKIEGAIEELYTASGLREDYPEAQMLLAQALVA